MTTDLIVVTEKLVAERGTPGHIRSDNGREFVARTPQIKTAKVSKIEVERVLTTDQEQTYQTVGADCDARKRANIGGS